MGGGECEWEVRYGCKNGNECQYVEGVSVGPDISSYMTFNRSGLLFGVAAYLDVVHTNL